MDFTGPHAVSAPDTATNAISFFIGWRLWRGVNPGGRINRPLEGQESGIRADRGDGQGEGL
ncbi:hypothetical protein GCM10012319_34060 [Comamonas sp. KCTC 72670]|nr:hypothetical protein GCM10012319_34060 [Comamonas sp. KCTC 72670]